MSTGVTSQIILTCAYIVIIALLFVIRKYQKKLKKSKQETLLIHKTINSFNPNNLEELNRNYQILISMLDNIQKDENCDEEIG